MTKYTDIKYEPTKEWWNDFYMMLVRITGHLKSIKSHGMPYTTNRGHVVSGLEIQANRVAIETAMERDGKKHPNFNRVSGCIPDYRRGVDRHGGAPHSDFILTRMAADRAAGKTVRFLDNASSEEE